MALELIILISLVIVLAGTLPWWRYSRGWGYGAPGFIGMDCNPPRIQL